MCSMQLPCVGVSEDAASLMETYKCPVCLAAGVQCPFLYRRLALIFWNASYSDCVYTNSNNQGQRHTS